MHRLLIVLCVGLLASTGDAKPCRPGFPNCRRPPPPPPPPPAVTTIYQRVVPATLAYFDRAGIARLLAGSAWTRLGGREQIRFVEPPGQQQFAQPPEGGRDRGIRAVRIELTRAGRVMIDGTAYTITACQTQRRVMTTCLESRDVGRGFGGQGYGGTTYGGVR